MNSTPVNNLVIVLGTIVMLSGWAIYIFDWDPIGIRDVTEIEKDFWFRTVLVTNEDGQICATPDPLSADVKDRIRWENPSGKDFRIEFENQRSPFAESEFSAEEAKRYKDFRDDIVWGDDFKYAVIFGTDTLDPVIRIEQDPPPGGDSSGVVKN